jgi:hypothetical protein
MRRNKLKLVNILSEQISSNDSVAINKIVNFMKTASDTFFETEQGKKLKDFVTNYLPQNVYEPLKSFTHTVTSELQSTSLTSDDDFYKAILNCIGAPITKENMKFLYAWRQAEGGSARNNPFNTTKNKTNSTFYNCLSKDSLGNCKSGVKNYQTKQDGVEATCETLKLPMYKSLLDQLKSGNSTAEEMSNNQQALKTWGTGNLIAKVVKGYSDGSKPNPPSIAV